jgi:hypothetical protein
MIPMGYADILAGLFLLVLILIPEPHLPKSRNIKSVAFAQID